MRGNWRSDDPLEGWEVTKPWSHNREGECFLCGMKFGYYDTKFIEIAEPHRLMCLFGPPYGCGHKELGEIDEKEWYYWTDG